MFRLTRPDQKKIEELLKAQSKNVGLETEQVGVATGSNTRLPFSYPEVGTTRSTAPRGYNLDHNRVLLGHGRETFSAAVSAVNDWKMFDMSWIELIPPRPSVKVGETVAVVVRHFGFWSVNVSRVVYTIEEDERYGFAYGTLPCHAEKGEERFTVEHSRADEVWYDLYAFSKPRSILARAGYPISRRLQKRFARDSLAAMRNAVSG